MLPNDYKARKALQLYTYLTQYHPEALLELVKVSAAGNEQHNPGEPLHWEQGKSMDQLNTAMRHIFDHGTGQVYDESDTELLKQAGIDGRVMHLAKAAWRLLAEITLLVRMRAAGLDIEQCVRGSHEALKELADVAEHNEDAIRMASHVHELKVAVATGSVIDRAEHPEARTETQQLIAADPKGNYLTDAELAPMLDSVTVPQGTGGKPPKGRVLKCGCFGHCAGLTPNCPCYPAHRPSPQDVGT